MENMSEGILVAIFGLLGALIGSGITVISQFVFERRKERQERKNKRIEKINNILPKLNYLLNLLDKILDFITTDFNNINDDDLKNVYDNLSNLYNDKCQYFWDLLVMDLYIVLPKTSKTLNFQILDSIVSKTKNISENINDYLESEDTILSGLNNLQHSFNQLKDKYIVAKYTVYKLIEEYFSEISRNIKIKKEMEKFYKKYKKIIKHGIKKW
jgi:predicted PurR-regulated permease PerM